MADSWFQDKFAKLQIDENRLGDLSDIHDTLQTLNSTEIAQKLSHNKIQLSTVLNCCVKEDVSR